MKHTLLLLVAVTTFAFIPHTGFSQITPTQSAPTDASKPRITISTVSLKNDIVQFTLVSSKHFIVGGNIYVLTIGNKEFPHSTQDIMGDNGIITFLIPKADFDALPDGSNIYLTYGHSGKTARHTDPLNDHTATFWSVGIFSKALLR